MSKIAIYTRVSSSGQLDREGDSLEVQREKCKMLMISIGKEESELEYFTDEAISGKTTTARVQMTNLLDRIRNQSKDDIDYIEGICAYSLSRLSRSVKDTLQIYEELKNRGLSLFTADGMFRGELNDSNSLIMTTIMGMVNQLYNENLRNAVIPGMYKIAEKGYYAGGMPPLGYDLEPMLLEDGKVRNMLKVNNDESKLVKRIFKMYVEEGYSLYSISQTLNLEGIRTKRYGKRGGSKFTTINIKQIIDNEIYVGKIIFGKHTRNAVTGKREVRYITKEEILQANGRHDPIVTLDTFLKAREISEKRARPKSDRKMANERLDREYKEYTYMKSKMFSNILKCPCCGSKMTTSRVKSSGGRDEYYYYICLNNNSGKGCGASYRVKEEIVLDLIKDDLLKGYLNQYKLLNVYLNKRENKVQRDKNLSDLESEKLIYIENLRGNKKTNENKLDKILDELLETDSEFLKEKLKDKMKGVEKGILDINKKIHEIEKELKALEVDRQILMSNLNDFSESDFNKYFKSLTTKEKRLLLEQRYKKIVIETEGKRNGRQKTFKLKEVQYNERFSIKNICKVLNIDFMEFFNVLKNEGYENELIPYLNHSDDIEILEDIIKTVVMSEVFEEEFISENLRKTNEYINSNNKIQC